MKISGIVIALPTVVAAALLVWLFHVVTFGEPNPQYMFESEPPEGYDYWMRKSFWADFWPFVGYSLVAVATGLIPIAALLFATTERSRNTLILITVLGAILAIPPGSMTVMAVAAQNYHFVFWAAPVLLGGCIYAIIRSTISLAKLQAQDAPSNR